MMASLSIRQVDQTSLLERLDLLPNWIKSCSVLWQNCDWVQGTAKRMLRGSCLSWNGMVVAADGIILNIKHQVHLDALELCAGLGDLANLDKACGDGQQCRHVACVLLSLVEQLTERLLDGGLLR
jgi:hypothetical protein